MNELLINDFNTKKTSQVRKYTSIGTAFFTN